MKITKKPNLVKYKKAIDKIQTKNGLAPAINETIVEIQQRTRKGSDTKGSSFKPYSKAYKSYKSMHYGSSKVNLTQTGNMLHSMTFKGIKGGVRIYFGSAVETKKAYHNQIINSRKFFGLSKQQRDSLLKYVKNYYKKTTK